MADSVVVNYLNNKEKLFEIVPLKMQRSWMNDTRQKFAYKCLPLNIANQYGWAVVAPFDFEVSWYGGDGPESVDVMGVPSQYKVAVTSHFAHQTFTFAPDFILQTPPGYSLYIRGIPNKEYKCVQPLDAIVETDWLPYPFTYNFRFTEPGTVSFKKGEPIFCFFPIKRNTVESFDLVCKDLKENFRLNKDFQDYSDSRNKALSSNPENGKSTFQKFYIDGRGPNKKYHIKDHMKRIFFKDPKPEE